MRPASQSQSAFRYPLNHLLGTPARVRILRAILASDIPISVSELARLTGLQRSGVDRTCVQLEDLGAIEAVGRGTRNRQYRRAPRAGIVAQLATLFAAERSRADGIIAELRQIMADPSSGIRAAWIEGPVATGTDLPQDPIHVGLLTDASSIDWIRDRVWGLLLGLQDKYDIRLELRVWTMADLTTAAPLERRGWSDVLLLHGPSPADLVQSADGSALPTAAARPRRHETRDDQAKALARAIADRIRGDSTIVEEAKRYVARRLAGASPGEQLELREWASLLATLSVSRLRRFLVEDSERARRLRQSLPFLDVLSADERQALLASVRDES